MHNSKNKAFGRQFYNCKTNENNIIVVKKQKKKL